LGEWSQVGCVDLLDLESALPDEGWNVSCHVAPFECPFEKRLSPLLPSPHLRIGREPVLKEDELATRPQYSSETLNGLYHVGNRAQRKGADNGIDAGSCQGYAFSRQVEKLNVQPSIAALLFGTANHSPVRFKRIHFAYPCWVIVNEVHAWSYADFKHFPLRQRDETLTNLLHGLRVPQYAYEMGIHMILVERHSCLVRSCSPAAAQVHRYAADVAETHSSATVSTTGLLLGESLPIQGPESVWMHKLIGKRSTRKKPRTQSVGTVHTLKPRWH